MQFVSSSSHSRLKVLNSYQRKTYPSSSNIPTNLDHPSPPNARSTTEETKKLFGFCGIPVIDAVETGRSKVVENKNADAMQPLEG